MQDKILETIKQIKTEKENTAESQISKKTKLKLVKYFYSHPEEYAKVGKEFLLDFSNKIYYTEEEVIAKIEEEEKNSSSNLDYTKSSRWSNYIENQELKPARIYNTTSLLEIKEVVRAACCTGVRVRYLGKGNSFSTILQATKDDYVILPNKMQSVLDGSEPFALLGKENDKITLLADPTSSNLVEVQAGIPIVILNRELEKRGKAVKTMGAFDAQTIMGVISTSTHGSRHDTGPIPDMVRSLLMIVRNGDIVRVEPSDGITNKQKHDAKYGTGENAITLIQDDKIFYSVLVSMGCMGIVYSLVLEVEDKYYLAEERRRCWLNEKLEKLESWKNPGSKYSTPKGYLERIDTIDYNLLVNPYPGDSRNAINHKDDHKCIITRRKKTLKTRPQNHAEEHRSFLLTLGANIELFGAISVDCLTAAKRGRRVRNLLISALDAMHDPFDYVAKSNKVFIAPKPKGVKGLAMEITLPFDYTSKALRYALKVIGDLEKKKQFFTAPISVRFVGKSKAYLSQFTAYGENSKNKDTDLFVCLEFLMIDGTKKQIESLNYLQRKMIEKFGTNLRVHWGLNFGTLNKNYPYCTHKENKECYLNEERYPKIKEWMEVYKDFNQNKIFSNKFTEQMGFDQEEEEESNLLAQS